MRPPDDQHWFGTDGTGRDIFSRVIFGARNTLLIGVIGVSAGGLLGGVLGVLAAFYRALDSWIMRLVDIMLAFPAILIGLAVAAITGAGIGAVVFALVVATIPDVARVSRGAAIAVMAQDFIAAGRAPCVTVVAAWIGLGFGGMDDGKWLDTDKRIRIG
jgi:ABC-type dipeptide/oligopeptide/nickel transport system permease subunit